MSKISDVSRRDVFKTAGAIVPASAAIQNVPRTETVKAAIEPVRYGVIGLEAVASIC